MPTKIELTLEQSQQGISNDVLVDSKNLLNRVSSSKRRVILHKSVRLTMLASSHYRNVSKQTTRCDGDECDKGIMQTKIELTLEQSQQGVSNDVLGFTTEAANILTSGGATASVSPTEVLPAAGFPTVSGSVPTISAIFTTASVKVVASEVPKKRKLQEQIDAQVAKEMEEEFARESQRLSEQLARDSEIARLHAEEELNMIIEGLDRSNEVIAKHLQEYEQSELDLFVGEKLELINELVKYQDHQKFIHVWKQLEDFVPMFSKEEGERVKRQGLKIDQGSSKRIKTSEDVFEEEHKGMMHLVPLEEVYVEALQVKHPIINWEIHSEGKREYWKIIRLGGHTAVYQFFVDMLKQFDREDLHHLWTFVKETFSIRQATKDKEKELWVELKRLFELDFNDQLWTHNQAFIHDPLDWKLYDTCGVHHVSTKDQEIFMLVKMDCPLRRGLATVMISNKLQGRIVGNKMLQGIPTASYGIPFASALCHRCTKHMTGNLKLLCNFVEKFLGTVRFGNDQFAPVLGYGDLVQGNVMINRVYYVEGLNHNLFSVGSDLYIISLQESTSLTPLCLMARATLTQACLWHRRLSHLNFDYINLLLKKDIVIGLPKLKYVKDQLCSSCELSKVKRSSFKSKAVPSSKERLNLLHIDLCGPMRVASINGKKYIMVIVDDYSRYTWTLFLRSKDETPEVLKEFLTMIQRNL
nr:hypothetical protein [Tanacetum cinerariifolium]